MAADSITEELVRLLRGISVSLTLKLSHFISFVSRYKKNASSAGAVVGLAIALFCTWRYCWRMPRRKRSSSSSNQNINKREEEEEEEEEEGRGAGAGAGAGGLDSSRSMDSHTQQTAATAAARGSSSSSSSSAIARSITQAVKRSSNSSSLLTENTVAPPPSLAKLVKQKLKGGRKMTCQLLGVILEQSSAEELQKQHHAATATAAIAVVRPSVVEVLLEIARACDLYLIARVLDDESEESVLAALDAVGFFLVPGANRNKVLFCSTEAGSSSFVRQLEPDWHVDNVRDTNAALAPFVRHQLHIALLSSRASSQAIASNVFLGDSLEQFFGFPASS